MQPTSITVCITSFNQLEYLSKAFASVLNQTRLPDQIVIIDDASSDGSQDLIRSYAREHKALVFPIFNEINQGVGESRKRALLASTCDLVTFLDGDDLYLPHKLALQEQALLQNTDAGFVYSNFAFIDEVGNRTGIWFTDSSMPSGNIFSHIAARNFPRGACHRNELARREAMVDTMDCVKGRTLYEDDFETSLRLSRFNTAVAISEVSSLYRVHAAGWSMISCPKHYDAINFVYSKNEKLLDGIDRKAKNNIQAGIDSVLAEYAWRAVRQMARGQVHKDKTAPSNGPLHYAAAAIAHRPSSIINPKRTSQIVCALIRY